MTDEAADGHEDFIMRIQDHTFCWFGISTDVATGKAFYPGVLGWDVADDTVGPPTFIAPGGAVAHLQSPENGPPSWCSFLSVADVDASTARAAEHGSAVIVPPTDLPAGRFSVVTTPSGAVLGLYQAAPSDVLATPGPGSITWVSLQSTTVEKDLAWFAVVFGLTHKVESTPKGPYHVLEADGVARGGVVSSNGDASSFVAWVQVGDLDATLVAVTSHGGKVVTEAFGDPMRRMAVVSDPSGATFGLVQPR